MHRALSLLLLVCAGHPAWAEAPPTLTSSTAPRAAPPPPHGAELTVRLSGLLQAEGIARFDTSADQVSAAGEPLNDVRFVIRRARLRAQASFGWASGALELDASTARGPSIRLLAAEVSATLPAAGAEPPPLALTLGLFKIPFGFEVPEKTERRAFHETSAVGRALWPGEYDLGLKLQGAYGPLRYLAAVMNGNPAQDRSFPLRDGNLAKDLLGRVGLELGEPRSVRVIGGVSGMTGKALRPGRAATAASVSWTDADGDGAVDAGELQPLPGSPALPTASFRHAALGADVRLELGLPRLGQLLLFAEGVLARNLDRGLVPADPLDRRRDLPERGYLLGFVQQLGDFAVGLRHDHYQPDAGAEQPAHAAYSGWSFLGAWRPLEQLRLSIQYDLQVNAPGRGAEGVATEVHDDAFTARAQLAF